MDFNRLTLEVGKLHIISKSGKLITLNDTEHNVLQVAMDHFIEHCGDLIQGGNLDEEAMEEVETESFAAQDLKEIIDDEGEK